MKKRPPQRIHFFVRQDSFQAEVLLSRFHTGLVVFQNRPLSIHKRVKQFPYTRLTLSAWQFCLLPKFPVCFWGDSDAVTSIRAFFSRHIALAHATCICKSKHASRRHTHAHITHSHRCTGTHTHICNRTCTCTCTRTCTCTCTDTHEDTIT